MRNQEHFTFFCFFFVGDVYIGYCIIFHNITMFDNAFTKRKTLESISLHISIV